MGCVQYGGIRRLITLGLLGWGYACGTYPDGQVQVFSENVPAGLSDLQITELLILPKPRSSGAWIELHNASESSVCLGGAVWEVWHRNTLLKKWPATGCLAAREFLIVGDAPWGSASEKTVFLAWGNLPPAEGTIVLRLRSDVLAEASWGARTPLGPAVAGQSFVRVPSQSQTSTWCLSDGEPFDGVNRGSPGEENLGCYLCFDTDQRRRRPVRWAGEHQLELSEVFNRPHGPRRGQQFIALTSLSDEAIDLVEMALVTHLDGQPARRWQLMGVGCKTLLPNQTLRIPMSQPSDAKSSSQPLDLFFSGPVLPVGDMGLSLHQRGQTLVRAVVPKSQQNKSVRPICP